MFKKIIEWIYLRMEGNLVYYDTTTKCKSRYYYDHVAKEEYKNKRLCIIFIDIDGLKIVNDKQGHHFGTKLIKQVSSELLKLDKVKDVCRSGGDEFVLFCEEDFDITQLEKVESISYGIYMKEFYEDIITAIKTADERMYIMKQNKRGR